jgi:Flp pilus assembly protein TadB
MESALWWSIIGVAGAATIALGYIWWKTSQIKKEAREGTYVTKAQKEELKKQGIKVKDFKKQLREADENNKPEIKSHEDYMAELRRMG